MTTDGDRSRSRSRSRRLRWIATVLCAVAFVEVAVAIGAGAASGLGWARLTDLFAVTNALLGASLAVTGWPIAYHRPGNLVGWSLLLGGCCYASSAAGVAVLAWIGESSPPWRVLATLTNGGWTWALALFVPLALVLFPDGRLPGPGWRWLVALLAVNGVAWTGAGVLDPQGGLTAELGIPGYPALGAFWQISWFEVAAQVGFLVSFGAALTALFVRYRRGSERVRQQVLWVLWALLVIVSCALVAYALQIESLVMGVLPLLLIPSTIAIAVLRRQLLDIRLVISRSTLYVLLTGGVIAAYLALVTLLDTTVRRQVSLNSSVLATLVIALAFNPARVWLQRRVHRAFYGARGDPVRAIAVVGARLGDVGGGSGPGLAGALAALCRVLRLPAAAIVVDGAQIAAHGALPGERHAVVLGAGDTPVGELVVGLRSGESRFDPADERVLTLLAAPLAVAVQAQRLAEELGASRERVISGREEERRRIWRDLHDGLGPVLTGVVLNADAALRLIDTDRDRSGALLATVRDQTIAAIEVIRRVVYDLRPPALDGLGLVGALQEYAVVLSRRGDGGPLAVTVDAPAAVGELPAAVEVAAYRIATEALTNVARHSTATTAAVRLSLDGRALRVEVHDNGVNSAGGWAPGVGLTAAGEAIFGPGVARRALAYLSAPRSDQPAFPELTPREREVLALIAAGHGNAAIARRLGVATATVGNHITNIFAKLQVASRAEAIIRARSAGLGT